MKVQKQRSSRRSAEPRWVIGAVFLGVCFARDAWSAGMESSPYEEGVRRVALTPAERESLLLYANDSKTNLERAVREAKGKPLAEANEIYLAAIKRVVAESYQERRRSELLMRMALNQAMELTVGTPSPDGKAIEKVGVLKSAGNGDLLSVILEESITLALTFYQDDRSAIESNSLILLPYSELAQRHLRLGSEWLSGINEWSVQLAFQRALLEQWKSTALQEGHLTQVRLAGAIIEVDDALTKTSESGLSVQQKVRFLRAVLNRVMEARAPSRNPSMPMSATSWLEGAFQWIPAGSFVMGSSDFMENGHQEMINLERMIIPNQVPHSVTLSRGFEMLVTPVTQAQWVAVMGENPSTFKDPGNCHLDYQATPVPMCPNHPVESVSWDELTIFLVKLRIAAKDDSHYRLPTEAEWEYAARAGSRRAFFFGDDESKVAEYAWFSKNAGKQTHAVATRKRNAFGLYDMIGNVRQWVADAYNIEYQNLSSVDPHYTGGDMRVIRGGGFSSDANGLHSGRRTGGSDRRSRFSDVGFRIVRTRVP